MLLCSVPNKSSNCLGVGQLYHHTFTQLRISKAAGAGNVSSAVGWHHVGVDVETR
jgi:hypothetical protein